MWKKKHIVLRDVFFNVWRSRWSINGAFHQWWSPEKVAGFCWGKSPSRNGAWFRGTPMDWISQQWPLFDDLVRAQLKDVPMLSPWFLVPPPHFSSPFTTKNPERPWTSQWILRCWKRRWCSSWMAAWAPAWAWIRCAQVDVSGNGLVELRKWTGWWFGTFFFCMDREEYE